MVKRTNEIYRRLLARSHCSFNKDHTYCEAWTRDMFSKSPSERCRWLWQVRQVRRFEKFTKVLRRPSTPPGGRCPKETALGFRGRGPAVRLAAAYKRRSWKRWSSRRP
jgi:hypothetical protein